ncbi:MAG: sulfotransferase [Bacteroidota bacterium]
MRFPLRLLSSIIRRHSLHNQQQRDQQAPFFIIGSGRSGTTLLRSLLYRHPSVHIPPETDFALPQAIRIFQQYQWLSWPVLVHLVLAYFQFNDAFQYWELNLRQVKEQLMKLPKSEQTLYNIIDHIYRAHGAKEGKENIRWGDKTPLLTFGLPEINQLFPHAKFIEMIRDGRAVVNSYLQFGRYQSIDEACDRWQDSLTAVADFQKQIGSDRIIQIRYESLVEEPEDHLKQLCTFLQLDFHPVMLVHDKQAMGDTVLSHHANVHQPVSVQHREKWRKELSTEQIQQIQARIGQSLTKQGYQLD